MERKKTKRLNGDGSFCWREDRKKWEYHFTVPNQFTDDGKAIRKSVYANTQAECKSKAKEIIAKYENGTETVFEDMTIKVYGEYDIERRLNLNKIQRQTAHRDFETLKTLSPIYNTRLQAITSMQLNKFLIDYCKDYADSYIDKIYILLSRIFRNAVEDKIIAENPMKRVEKPRSNQKKVKVRALTIEEQRKFMTILATEDVRYSEEMLLSLVTGMRMGEVLALQVCDIDFRFGTIFVHKTMATGEKGQPFVNEQTKTEAGTRTIRMTADANKILSECCKGKDKNDYIFTRDDGSFIAVPMVNSQFIRARQKYQFIEEQPKTKVDLHSLRHTFATRCIESGMQAKVLQHLLGHKDITTTYDRYGDVFDHFENENILKAEEYMQKVGMTIKNILEEHAENTDETETA